MVKTRHPGIYKRGSRYVVRFRSNGKRHAESCRTLEEALQIKRSREAARDRGELDLVTQARTPLRDYAAEWVERYQGNGRRGFTDDTRHEYRRDLKRYVYPFLGDRRIGSLNPREVAEWIAWLCDDEAQGRRVADEKADSDRMQGKPVKRIQAGPVRLSDATVRRIVSPLRACLATARREGLIRSNPCDGVPLPHRPQIEEADQPEKAKALTREQLAMFLRIVPNEWQPLFEVLAATGLRWSELAALRWSDLALDGSESNLRVRRALAKRQPRGEPRYKPPKSRHGLRSIPLDASLCRKLRQRRIECEAGDDDLVFPARNGAPLRQENVRRRVLAIAAEEAGVPWIGFHTFRHTCASLLFAAGRNVKQVQRWLGHHSPGFTLDTYVHLLDDGVGGGLDLAAELAQAQFKAIPGNAVDDGISPSSLSVRAVGSNAICAR